jgi:hypothetical protein
MPHQQEQPEPERDQPEIVDAHRPPDAGRERDRVVDHEHDEHDPDDQRRRLQAIGAESLDIGLDAQWSRHLRSDSVDLVSQTGTTGGAARVRGARRLAAAASAVVR